MQKLEITHIHRAISYYVAILLGAIVLFYLFRIFHNLFFETALDPDGGGWFVCYNKESLSNCEFSRFMGQTVVGTTFLLIIFITSPYIIPFIIISAMLITGLYFFFKKKKEI